MNGMDGLNSLSQAGQDQGAEQARHDPLADGSAVFPGDQPAFDILQPEGC